MNGMQTLGSQYQSLIRNVLQSGERRRMRKWNTYERSYQKKLLLHARSRRLPMEHQSSGNNIGLRRRLLPNNYLGLVLALSLFAAVCCSALRALSCLYFSSAANLLARPLASAAALLS